MKRKTETESQVMVLMAAAGAVGITLDGLLAHIAAVGLHALTRESVQTALRSLLASEHVELHEGRWYATEKGKA